MFPTQYFYRTILHNEFCWYTASEPTVCICVILPEYRFFVCWRSVSLWSAMMFFCLQSKGAKEKVVTRIMVSRCEVDLMKIRREFKRQHKRSLYQTIAVSTCVCVCVKEQKHLPCGDQ